MAANRLRELRLGRRLQMRATARILGMTPIMIHRHESGEAELDSLAIDRYRRLYNVRPLELWLTRDQIRELVPELSSIWDAQDARRRKPEGEDDADEPNAEPDYAGDLVPMSDDVLSPDVINLKDARERALAWSKGA